MSPETRAIVATCLLALGSIAAIAWGAWMSRHTRHKDRRTADDD